LDPRGVEDVEAIKAYVARDSVRYAALLAERIVAAVDRLESFPESVQVVTVYHASRLLGA